MLKLCYLSFGQHCKIALEKLWHIFGKWPLCFINSHACYFGNLFIVYRSAKSVPAWPRSSPVTWAAEPSRSSSKSSSQTPSLTPSSRGAGQSTPCRYVKASRKATPIQTFVQVQRLCPHGLKEARESHESIALGSVFSHEILRPCGQTQTLHFHSPSVSGC